VARVIIGVISVFQSIMVEMINNSPMSFGVGGSPRFDTQAIIHQMVSRGVTNLNPRVIDRVRVLFRSYSNFAKQNKAEDIRPWAIINISPPFIPHREIVKIPDATILMCPTEE